MSSSVFSPKKASFGQTPAFIQPGRCNGIGKVIRELPSSSSLLGGDFCSSTAAFEPIGHQERARECDGDDEGARERETRTGTENGILDDAILLKADQSRGLRFVPHSRFSQELNQPRAYMRKK